MSFGNEYDSLGTTPAISAARPAPKRSRNARHSSAPRASVQSRIGRNGSPAPSASTNASPKLATPMASMRPNRAFAARMQSRTPAASARASISCASVARVAG